jgi:hypothetical protein
MQRPTVVRYSSVYPERRAGSGTGVQASDGGGDRFNGQNMYAPFASRLDWEVARWAKLRGAGSTAFSDLLAVEGVRRHYPSYFGMIYQLIVPSSVIHSSSRILTQTSSMPSLTSCQNDHVSRGMKL